MITASKRKSYICSSCLERDADTIAIRERSDADERSRREFTEAGLDEFSGNRRAAPSADHGVTLGSRGLGTKDMHIRGQTQAEPGNNDASRIAGSKRQQEVLDLLFRGFTYREIANLLLISEDTIRTYIKRLYRRLDVTSRSEAVFEAQRAGLLRS